MASLNLSRRAIISRAAIASAAITAAIPAASSFAMPAEKSQAAWRFDVALARFYGTVSAVELCPCETPDDEARLDRLVDQQVAAAKFLDATPAPDLERFVAKLRALCTAADAFPIEAAKVETYADELAALVLA